MEQITKNTILIQKRAEKEKQKNKKWAGQIEIKYSRQKNWK